MKSNARIKKKIALAMVIWNLGTTIALVGVSGAQAQQRSELQVLVNEVSLEGNATYDSETLLGLIASEIGRPMTLKQIQETAERITEFYHQNGYPLVRVVVPEQAFGDDRPVRLVVLEGQLGHIGVMGNQRFADRHVIAALSAAGERPGQPINLQQVERALAHLNRRSGITTEATLRPGTEQGFTDLQIDVKEAPRISGSLQVNNFGSETTGRYRVLPRLTFENLTGRGDELNAIAMTSLGDGEAWFGYATYVTPLNAGGTRLETYASTGNVSVGRDFKALEIQGDSQSLGLGLHQEQVFSARQVLTYSAWLESADLQQSILDTRVIDDKIRKLRLGAALDSQDLSGSSLLSLELHQGLGETLGGMQDDSLDSSRAFAGADNDFTKLTMSVMRIQRLSPRLVAVPSLFAQYAFDSVVSGEQFSVGGANSVKGHPPAVYSGDSGITASLEGRYDLLADDSRFQLIGSLGHGRIDIRTPVQDQDDSQAISGASLGVLATPLPSLELRLEWGVPLGSRTEDSGYAYAQTQYRF